MITNKRQYEITKSQLSSFKMQLQFLNNEVLSIKAQRDSVLSMVEELEENMRIYEEKRLSNDSEAEK